MNTNLTCACGQVSMAVEGEPIISAECHCTSCRTSGTRLDALPAAMHILEKNGGTQMVLYRKDRVSITHGLGVVMEMRLGPDATTRRAVAGCCKTPLFLEFKGGHWVSIYSRLWPEPTRPSPQLRTMTIDRIDPEPLPDDIPNSRRQSVTFMAKLLGAWIGMGFRAPRMEMPGGRLDA
jgi:hypothetical protein